MSGNCPTCGPAGRLERQARNQVTCATCNGAFIAVPTAMNALRRAGIDVPDVKAAMRASAKTFQCVSCDEMFRSFTLAEERLHACTACQGLWSSAGAFDRIAAATGASAIVVAPADLGKATRPAMSAPPRTATPAPSTALPRTGTPGPGASTSLPRTGTPGLIAASSELEAALAAAAAAVDPKAASSTAKRKKAELLAAAAAEAERLATTSTSASSSGNAGSVAPRPANAGSARPSLAKPLSAVTSPPLAGSLDPALPPAAMGALDPALPPAGAPAPTPAAKASGLDVDAVAEPSPAKKKKKKRRAADDEFITGSILSSAGIRLIVGLVVVLVIAFFAWRSLTLDFATDLGGGRGASFWREPVTSSSVAIGKRQATRFVSPRGPALLVAWFVPDAGPAANGPALLAELFGAQQLLVDKPETEGTATVYPGEAVYEGKVGYLRATFDGKSAWILGTFSATREFAKTSETERFLRSLSDP